MYTHTYTYTYIFVHLHTPTHVDTLSYVKMLSQRVKTISKYQNYIKTSERPL